MARHTGGISVPYILFMVETESSNRRRAISSRSNARPLLAERRGCYIFGGSIWARTKIGVCIGAANCTNLVDSRVNCSCRDGLVVVWEASLASSACGI